MFEHRRVSLGTTGGYNGGMLMVTRRVDQPLRIGRDIVVTPTDIDATGVRMLAKGRIVGGAQDGESTDTVHELQKGQTFHVGPMVAITVLDVRGPAVRLGISAPAHMEVATG